MGNDKGVTFYKILYVTCQLNGLKITRYIIIKNNIVGISLIHLKKLSFEMFFLTQTSF